MANKNLKGINFPGLDKTYLVADNIENGIGKSSLEQIKDESYTYVDTGNNLVNEDATNGITNERGDAMPVDATTKKPLLGARGAFASAFGGNSLALGKRAHAEGSSTVAFGSYSHAEGNGTYSKGVNSHAEGTQTTAGEEAAHSEGLVTKAIGKGSHAEGQSTEATGLGSHAEGYGSKASNEFAHAEGYETEASGMRSHAEGVNTTAAGYASHAEGQWTQALVGNAHAEGYHTIAAGDHQHVQGKYNVTDTSSAFIIGNGDAEDVVDSNGNVIEQNRSNAMTVDWDGNAYFSGEVFVEKNKKLAKNIEDGLGENSLSQTNCQAVGDNSFAAGNDTTTMGACSHAEGKGSQASAELDFSAQITGVTETTLVAHLSATSLEDLTETIALDAIEQNGFIVKIGDGTLYPIQSAQVETKEFLGAPYEATITMTIAPGHTFRTKVGKGEVALTDCTVVDILLGVAYGNQSHLEGDSNVAIGTSAHAEGYLTNASGETSHTEGNKTLAAGRSAHAEGNESKAFGEGSHAEGYNTESSGYASHSEGGATKAIAEYAHAEGQGAQANFRAAHAEGLDTHAEALAAHAEGINTKAIRESAHAEGSGTEANAVASHAEGQNTKANAEAAHAEGQNTSADNEAAHAEGYQTVALRAYTHAEGNKTTAGGYSIDLNGNYLDNSGNKTSKPAVYTGIAAHAEGNETCSTGNAAHAEGYQTRAIGACSHAEGAQTTAFGVDSHAQGRGTIAYGETSLAAGVGKTFECYITGSGKNYTVKFNRADMPLEMLSILQSSFLIEYQGKMACPISIETINDDDDNYVIVDYVLSDDLTSSQVDSVAATAYTGISYGDSSSTFGKQNVAFAEYSFVGGAHNLATKYGAVAFGMRNRVFGPCSAAFGDNNQVGHSSYFAAGEGLSIDGQYSVALGAYNKSTSGLFVLGNGTDYDDRSDAFEINQDAWGRIASGMKFGGNSLGNSANETAVIVESNAVTFRHCGDTEADAGNTIRLGTILPAGNDTLAMSFTAPNNPGQNIRLSGIGEPLYENDAATKQYVDSKAATAVILTSPDGTKWQLTVDNDGTLKTEIFNSEA